jgi:spore maturation protein CgeB
MKFVLFYHSLSSDWNHGNAHFLRGVATELIARGHSVVVYEPADGWSLTELKRRHGDAAAEEFRSAYPRLHPRQYRLDSLDLEHATDGADVVLVHEWNPPELLERLGKHRASGRGNHLLLFHDTHHRAVSAPGELDGYPLEDFDGVLVFGEAIAEVYRQRGWGRRVWTWHEAADTRVFHPPASRPAIEGDLVWIGNWGDEERTAELSEFLFEPAREAGLSGAVYGVRYPESALETVRAAGLDYRGWVPNFRVPRLFERYRFTVHVPRRFYSSSLPGIPTIRVFEALACGIPLISAPWQDSEGLFRAGQDFLVVRNGDMMREAMRMLCAEPERARELSAHGRRTIERRHSCVHRVDELLGICAGLSTQAATA